MVIVVALYFYSNRYHDELLLQHYTADIDLFTCWLAVYEHNSGHD